MRYVIIGNSYAGTSAVASIREVDSKGEVVVISSENYRAYSRPLISYFLAGRIRAADMYYRDRSFYSKNNVELRLGEKVVGIDTKLKTVQLERGEDIDYDRLLISTGGRPSLQKAAGIDAKNVFTFTTWNDAKKLRETIRKKRKAVVLGGGLIGMKAAEGLKANGLDVSVVISSPRVLSLILDEASGKIMNRHLISSGIRLMTGHSVTEVHSGSGGEVSEVVLDTGKKIECGIVVVAKGVRPNVEFIKDSGISLNRGIIVDRQMKTNIGDVYSAGDSAEAWDLVNRRNSVIAIAPLACEQGRIAGYNMAGVNRMYNGGMSMNSIELSGLPLMAMGLSKGSEGMEVETFQKKGLYRKLVFSEDKLVGALLVGDVRYGGVLTHLIKSRSDISSIKGDLAGHYLKTGEFGFVSNK
ncbi:MAG: FAD-dependent oxidoreductase [Nitrospirota bacterium]